MFLKLFAKFREAVALNIPGIDWHKADLLASGFDYIYELSVASDTLLTVIDGISEDDAAQIIRFFAQHEKLVLLKLFAKFREAVSPI